MTDHPRGSIETTLARYDLYPWFFVLAPVASLLVQNIDAVRPGAALRVSLGLLAITAVALALGRRAFRNGRKAAVFWTLVILTSSLLGQLVASTSAASPPDELANRYRIAFALWLAVTALLAFAVARTRSVPPSVAVGLNGASIVALGIPILLLVFLEVRMADRWGSIQPDTPPPPITRSASTPEPDIYYIILDGYGRRDVLSEMYGLDQAPFYEALESRGFAIAERSHANYAQTSLSLASSLNLDYLDASRLAAAPDNAQLTLAGMIRHSVIAEVLRRHGYTSVAFSAGYRRAEMSTADIFVDPPHRSATPFEAMLLEVNAIEGAAYLPSLLGGEAWLPGYAGQRESIRFILEEAADLARRPEPTFAFVHVLVPHPPFLFEADGGARSPVFPYRLRDGNEFRGSSLDYVNGYAHQVTYVNAAILQLVDRLQQESSTPPVIILQGDHGPGSQLDWDSPAATNMWERMAILNAYAVPGLSAEAIDPTISPVNTFRLVLNHLFGYALETLPDRSYFSSWKDPYNFQHVTFSNDNSWVLDDAP